MGHPISGLIGFGLYFGAIVLFAYYAWQANQFMTEVGIAAFIMGILVTYLVNNLNAAEQARRKLEMETKEVK